MREVVEVIRREPRARWFLLAHAQSAIGTGAAAVALVVLAYDRMRSPWAITLVLLAEFLPAMVLSPLFGAMADRWSRKACAIAADLLSASAFIAIGLIDSFAATVALALVAGVGTALFAPAALAALPSLAAPERTAAVTSLYGAVRDVGRTLGPLVAALAFSLIGAANLMIVNGVTFALSALVLMFVAFGETAARAPGGYRQLLGEAREGIAITSRMPGVRIVVWASTAIIVFAAMVNVGELLLAHRLGAGATGFAVLMVAFGLGVVAGSLTGARGGTLFELKPRYVAGLLLVGAAVLGLALTPNFAAALIGFFAMGLGNGIVVVHERLIFHAAVPDRLMGRAFAVLETFGAWGFAIAYVAAGGLIAWLGTRGMFAVAGVGGLVVWLFAAISLRGTWNTPEQGTAPAPEPAAERS
jgi:MFS family permease